MSEKLDFYCIKIKVLNKNQDILFEGVLNKIKLREKQYEIEGIKKLGTNSPCVMERVFLEKEVCIEVAKKIEFNKKYNRKEIEWFFEIYDIEGEFVIYEI